MRKQRLDHLLKEPLVKFFGTSTTGLIRELTMGCYLVLKDRLFQSLRRQKEAKSFAQIFEIVRMKM